MPKKNLYLVILSFLLAGPSHAVYEAHEWGTFTSVVDSTGKTLNGMYHEDESLPDFVHSFGELRKEAQLPIPPVVSNPPKPPRPPCHSKVCFGQDELIQNVITQKMETPVIYFYAKEAQKVAVDVKFPEGIITETFPGPVATFPTMSDPHIIGSGHSVFDLNILQTKVGALPEVNSDNIYGHARAVASNLVKSGVEQEKFLFYRGLGRFQPKIEITSQGGSLKIAGLAKARPQNAFLIHVDANGDGQLLSLDNVKTKDEIFVLSQQIDQLKDHSSATTLIIKGQQARGKLIDELLLAGLFKDEAVAMLNTWENGYLKVPGLRLLYILPRFEVDEVLPLNFTPAPVKLVRAFVARMEIILDTDEQRILAEITKEQSQFRIEKLGRFAEPVLHRIRKLSEETLAEPATINVIDQLLKQAQVSFEASSSVH